MTAYSHSIIGIPENITYVYGDDNLESTRGARFQVNSDNERSWVVDIALSETPKTLRYRYVKELGLVRCRTGLDLKTQRGYRLLQRFAPGIFLVLLELKFRRIQRTEHLATNRSLGSDRPTRWLATHGSSDVGWIAATKGLILIRDSRLLVEEPQLEDGAIME